jgi:hypothetical protein
MESIDRREALKRVALLCGGALSAPTIAGVLSGCQTDSSASWSPAVLSGHQNDLVVTISERIIPATDTGGAEAAHVNRFIDAMLADGFPPEDRDRFLSGLDEVDADAESEHGAAFLECTPDQQTALMTTWDEAAFGPDASFDREAPPFFRTMKELTIFGYYTSEIGASQELRFDPVMGRYEPCVPFEEIGRTWA